MKKVFGITSAKVAGVTFDGGQGKLWYLRKNIEGAYLTVRHEKGNERDKNAVAVIAHCPSTNRHFQIGYMPREKALWMSRNLDAGLAIYVRSFEITGGRNTNLGVTVRLNYELPNVNIALVEQENA